MGEHDEDYLWLRQSATFVVNGQTRTVEIAIPVRRGCTSEELETLLDEADAGMARLSRHLDARIAEQTGTAVPPAAMPVTTPPATAPAPRVPASPPMEPAPRPTPPVAAPPPAPTAPRPFAPTSSIAERPAAQRTSPSAMPPQRPTPPTPAASGAPLTIPEFIAAISTEFGYNARQAMEELGVRTLSGLNLREALETLRRKHLRTGGPAAGGAPTDAPPVVPAPARSTPPATTPTRPTAAPAPPAPEPRPIASARYFEEEEDDADYTFDLEDEDAFAPAAPSHAPAAPLGAFGEDEPPLPDDDEFDLAGELPDFDALPPPPEEPTPSPTRARPAPTPRSTPSRATSAAPSMPSAFAAPPASVPTTGPLAGAEHMRGLPRLGQLRAIPVGGAATPYQRKAYHNLVISQLGEEATTLVAGVWRATPAQLGADQLEALIRWAKEDAFYDEARQVLAALTAERARAAANGPTDTAEDTASVPPSGNGRASASGPAPRRAASPRSRDATRDAEGGG